MLPLEMTTTLKDLQKKSKYIINITLYFIMNKMLVPNVEQQLTTKQVLPTI